MKKEHRVVIFASPQSKFFLQLLNKSALLNRDPARFENNIPTIKVGV